MNDILTSTMYVWTWERETRQKLSQNLTTHSLNHITFMKIYWVSHNYNGAIGYWSVDIGPKVVVQDL